MPVRRFLVAFLVLPPFAFADDVREVESVTFDIDTRVPRRMAAVADLVEQQEWPRAIESLRAIAREHAESLVEIEPGRYVDVAWYTNLVLSGLPAEGLAVYRAAVDAEANVAFERAVAKRDEAGLRRIVEETFAASVTDDALLRLGDLAFERGDLGTARECWTRLVPLPEGTVVPGEPAPRLRYPDADVPLPAVLGRLIAVTIQGGDLARADEEIATFGGRFPENAGWLFGREGRYIDLLGELRAEANDWPDLASAVSVTRFGGPRSSSLVAPTRVDQVAWSNIPPVTGLPIPVSRPLLSDDGPLTTHPVTWRDVLLVPGEDQVQAWSLATGAPWPDPEDTPVLHRTSAAVPFPRQPIVGVPRFTATVDDDLLYVRLGSPITGRGANELAEVGSEIVCLDLAGSEGGLLARITPQQVTGSAGWSFEGSPVVEDGRVFVLLRRIDPQTEIAAARLEVRPTGERDHEFRVVWFERVCGALEHVDGNRNVVSHLLPTLVGDSLFVSTDLGAVVSLDVATGATRWAVTYGRRDEDPTIEQASDHLRTGLLPPVVHEDRVFVAPNDTDDLFALDRSSGRVLWRRSLPDRIRHLLGVERERLIATGNSLWALDAHTGVVVWAKRRFEPEFFGYGRGLLAGGYVWWPDRTGISIVRAATGRPANGDPVPHRIDLTPLGLNGGNLAIADGRLVVIAAHRVTTFTGNRDAELRRLTRR